MRLLITILIAAINLNLYAQQRTLPVSEMMEDLHIIHGAWTSLHPGLYRYNTPAQVEAQFKQLQLTCSKPLTERKFYILLSQTAQRIKCGHTYLNPLNLDKETAARIMPEKVIPLFFEIIGKRQMIITKTLDARAPFRRGDEVVAINGIPVRQIMDSLLTVSRSDGNHATGKKYNNMNETVDDADNYSLFDIYFPLFFRQPTDWTVTIKKFEGKAIHRYVIVPMTLKARLATYESLYGSIATGERSWAYRLINRKTAYMKFGTFALWHSNFNETKYVDSAFRDLKKHPKITSLVIDIRGNEGGDNTGDYILSYITNRKLGCDDPDHRCYRFLTVPETLLPYLPTWDMSFKAPKDPAAFFVNKLGLYEKKLVRDDCAYIEPKAAHFGGKVYLLIDAKNSSAGYEMARNVKTNKLGTLVGETTGGSQQGINGGEFFFLTLPNSRFEIDLPLVFNYHPHKPDSGIVPDYTVTTTQRDIARQRDTMLQYLLTLIQKSSR